jgi:RNA polymerase sigma-32 factor
MQVQERELTQAQRRRYVKYSFNSKGETAARRASRPRKTSDAGDGEEAPAQVEASAVTLWSTGTGDTADAVEVRAGVSEGVAEVDGLAVGVHGEDWVSPGKQAPEEGHANVGAREGSAELARYDALAAYMDEVRRYPLLSREEEHELAVTFNKTHSQQVARRLVTANLRLVVKLAYDYHRVYHNLLDLVQEGNVGLVQAVQRYDPYRGVKLSSFAAWWIRAYMLRFILDNWRLVKIGTTQVQRKLFFNLAKEREKLESAGFTPTDSMLAERLSVPEREVTDMRLRLGASEVALDAPVGRGEDDARTTADLLECNSAERPDVTVEGREFRQVLGRKLAMFQRTLKGAEQTLFSERLIADQPLSLKEVGDRYGVSRERARQIEAKVLARLKVFLVREIGNEVQTAACC